MLRRYSVLAALLSPQTAWACADIPEPGAVLRGNIASGLLVLGAVVWLLKGPLERLRPRMLAAAADGLSVALFLYDSAIGPGGNDSCGNASPNAAAYAKPERSQRIVEPAAMALALAAERLKSKTKAVS